MENAAEALKLAAWVLIFVAALTISMNAFSQARQSLDVIYSNVDREYITEYIPESGSTEREVGFEAIIPAIYRAYKDNYKVVFPDIELYISSDGQYQHNLDLSTIGLQNTQEKEEFLKRVLFGMRYFQRCKR